jgi:hypothetical protein
MLIFKVSNMLPAGMRFIPAGRNANPTGALLAAGQLLGLPWDAAGAIHASCSHTLRFSLIPSPLPFLF